MERKFKAADLNQGFIFQTSNQFVLIMNTETIKLLVHVIIVSEL